MQRFTRQVCGKTVGFNMTEHDSIPRIRNQLLRMGSTPVGGGKAVINFVRPKMEQLRVDSRALFGHGLEVPASLDIIRL